MGIPLFRKALLRYVINAIRAIQRGPGRVHGLYIDANSVIHVGTRFWCEWKNKSKALQPNQYEDSAEFVVYCFEQIIRYFKPTDIVYLAVDGPVPKSKIDEQKERRYHKGVSLEKGEYDSSIITPGTEYMFILDKLLLERITDAKGKFHIKEIVHSSHKVPGEGEHKILSYMRKNKKRLEEATGSHVIYGNDSDLILLALALEMERIYVCNDTVQLRTESGENINKVREPLDIDAIRQELEVILDGDYINDFIFTCSLLGNDFLPRTPIMSNTEEALGQIISIVKKYAPREGGIRANLLGVFRTLALLETFQENTGSVSLLHLFDDYTEGLNTPEGEFQPYRSPIFDALIKYDALDESTFRTLWYRKSYADEAADDILQMCGEYIRGLFWVYNYYTKGQDAVTWVWYYPYHYAPMSSDLFLTYRGLLDDSIAGSEALQDTPPVEGEVRFTCLHQILAVMPWQSLEYVPEELYMFYRDGSPLLHLMPLTVQQDWEFSPVEHRSKIIVPKPLYIPIIQELAQRSFPLVTINKYANEKEYTNARPEPGRRPRPVLVEREEATESGEQTGEAPSQRGRGSDRGRGRGERGRGRDSNRGRGRGSGYESREQSESVPPPYKRPRGSTAGKRGIRFRDKKY